MNTTDQDREAVEYMSRSIAEMVIEWVDNANGLGWRVGLQKMIELRLSRLLKERDANMRARAASPAPEVPDGWASLYVGGGQFAICDWADWPSVRGYWWRLSSIKSNLKYAQAHSSHNTKMRHRITMHGLIMSPPPGLAVDHVNGNGLDNRRSNLRLATHQQNTWNQSGHGGTSAFKGVSFREDTKVWRAYITVDGNRQWLGSFASEVDAARAYNFAAKEAFGEYANINNID